MAWKRGISLAIAIVLVIGFPACSVAQNISRASFPPGFVFGTASSAFQFEGAVKEDGRGPSIWDTFSHALGKVLDYSNADISVDQYHRYNEDVQLMKDMGMDAYRFSISWSRIFPNGTGQINQAGVDYYNRLIDALLAKGIQPYVTLYHWDLPQALEDRYNGWLDPQVVQDFGAYADTCFEKFGDRVKHWMTLNEPHTVANQAYDQGFYAPGRCSNRHICKAGNSSLEPYTVVHHFILSSATASDIYRRKYKATQKGEVGAAFDAIWFEPETNSTENIDAGIRAQEFQLGWFLDPLFFGEYPQSMRTRVGSRLPTFTEAQKALIKGSLDFVGLNHYTTYFARLNTDGNTTGYDYLLDDGVITLPYTIEQKAIGDHANSLWLFIVPEGMRKMTNYIKQKYNNPTTIITENGMDDPNNQYIPVEAAVRDEKRIQYYNDYLTNLLTAIKEDGCNVKGYFAWSLMDNWEWTSGYTCRFGLYFVDYKDNLKRYPKDSAKWFKKFLSSTS